MTAVRVVIADDHRLFRRGIAALLATVDGIEVVGEAADGEHAVQLATEVRPDVVLLDLQMPGAPGLDAIRRIRVPAPGVHTLVLTMFDDSDSVFAVLRAGARGYVLKDTDGDELVRSILTVARSGALYSAPVAARLSEYLASPTAEPVPGPFGDLTPGEHRVLQQTARGLNNDAIARTLGYSPETVRNYVSIIFTKLQVTDRAQAIILARDHGLRSSAAAALGDRGPRGPGAAGPAPERRSRNRVRSSSSRTRYFQRNHAGERRRDVRIARKVRGELPRQLTECRCSAQRARRAPRARAGHPRLRPRKCGVPVRVGSQVRAVTAWSPRVAARTSRNPRSRGPTGGRARPDARPASA